MDPFFYCLQCKNVFDSYREHMDLCHDGRSDCVLRITAEQYDRVMKVVADVVREQTTPAPCDQ